MCYDTSVATKPSIKLVKEFSYQGAPKQYSNRYYFDGGTPADSTAWHALMDAFVAEEKKCYRGTFHSIVEAVGYLPGSEVPVATKAYTTPGTFAGTNSAAPGDTAAVLRQATTKISVKNHRVYVFTYFHAPQMDDFTPDSDTLLSTQKTAITAWGATLRTGITGGGITATRCTPDGHPVTGELTHEFIGHRDFPH